MNNVLIVIAGCFVGCLLENIMLGVIEYFLKKKYSYNKGGKNAKKNH